MLACVCAVNERTACSDPARDGITNGAAKERRRRTMHQPATVGVTNDWRKATTTPRIVIGRRVSGLGYILMHGASWILLGDKTGGHTYLDWRRSLYSNDSNLMHNLFGSYIRHPRARSIEQLENDFPEVVSPELKRMLAAARY